MIEHQLKRVAGVGRLRSVEGGIGDFVCACGLLWVEADGEAARAHVVPPTGNDDGQDFFDARFARDQRIERWTR